MVKKKVKKDTKKVTEKAVNKATQKFSKSSIINSAKYINKRDALSTILKDNVKYTLNEVDDKLKNFYEREVK